MTSANEIYGKCHKNVRTSTYGPSDDGEGGGGAASEPEPEPMDDAAEAGPTPNHITTSRVSPAATAAAHVLGDPPAAARVEAPHCSRHAARSKRARGA